MGGGCLSDAFTSPLGSTSRRLRAAMARCGGTSNLGYPELLVFGIAGSRCIGYDRLDTL